MSSETITRNDLTNIINEIFPATTEDMTQAQIDDFVASLNTSGTSIASILSTLLVTEVHSKAVSLPASDSANVDVNMTKTGYTLIGVVGVENTGTGSTLGFVSSFTLLDATTVRVALRNTTSTARSYTCYVRGLYLKDA